MGTGRRIKAFLLFLATLLGWPVSSHALLKELTPAQIKEAIKWGEQYQFSDFFLDRAYQFGPTEQQTAVVIATKYYQVARAAALAAKNRRPLTQEEIDRINSAKELQIRFQINYERPGGLFELFFPRLPTSPDLQFRLKQGDKVVEPSRVEPPLTWALTGGGTFKVNFPYSKINPWAVTRLIITNPQSQEETLKVNFFRLK